MGHMNKKNSSATSLTFIFPLQQPRRCPRLPMANRTSKRKYVIWPDGTPVPYVLTDATLARSPPPSLFIPALGTTPGDRRNGAGLGQKGVSKGVADAFCVQAESFRTRIAFVCIMIHSV